MLTVEDLRRALHITPFDPTPALLAMSPAGREGRRSDPPPRQAGVLALVVGQGGPSDPLHLVLTRRTERLNGHSGQMSFPGGRREEADPDFWHTALRETTEELGIPTDGITNLGPLTPLYIPPSHYDVFPWVGHLSGLPAFAPNPDEVAAVHLAPLDALLDPTCKQTVDLTLPGGHIRSVPAYLLCGQVVWGATAIMLSELEHRLRASL